MRVRVRVGEVELLLVGPATLPRAREPRGLGRLRRGVEGGQLAQQKLVESGLLRLVQPADTRLLSLIHI